MMKGCELCSYPAKMYCESDQASLCWDCDEKVHSANFLVAKHTRSLLCHVCQSLTPWNASGPKLGPTVSVCETCVDNCNGKQERGVERDEESQGGNDEEEDDGLEDGDDDTDDDGDHFDDSDDDDEEEDEDGENQVVPWSSTPHMPPPPAASSSTSEEGTSSRFSTGGDEGVSSFKRRHDKIDHDSEDDIGCSSSRFNHNITSMAMSHGASENEEAASWSSFRPPKVRRTNQVIGSQRVQEHGEANSRTQAAIVISSLRRFQQSTSSCDDDTSATILGIRKLSGDPRAVNLASTNPNLTH